MNDTNPEELTDTYTRLTLEEARDSTLKAFETYCGGFPQWECVLVLMAHTAHEVGRWKAMHAWNCGNIKSFENDGRCWTYFGSGCDEIIDGKRVIFHGRVPANRFRAYRTAESGFCDYIELLVTRYPEAWREACVGNPEGFVRFLKMRGYFTADLNTYIASVKSLYAEFNRTVPKVEKPVFSEGEVEEVLNEGQEVLTGWKP